MLFAWLPSYIKGGGATRLGGSEFRVKALSCVAAWSIPPGMALLFIKFNKECCEGSCVHQGLSGSVLRRVNSLHVACWILSSSSGYVHHVIRRSIYLIDSL
jgi:hypothetical protein